MEKVIKNENVEIGGKKLSYKIAILGNKLVVETNDPEIRIELEVGLYFSASFDPEADLNVEGKGNVKVNLLDHQEAAFKNQFWIDGNSLEQCSPDDYNCSVEFSIGSQTLTDTFNLEMEDFGLSKQDYAGYDTSHWE